MDFNIDKCMVSESATLEQANLNSLYLYSCGRACCRLRPQARHAHSIIQFKFKMPWSSSVCYDCFNRELMMRAVASEWYLGDIVVRAPRRIINCLPALQLQLRCVHAFHSAVHADLKKRAYNLQNALRWLRCKSRRRDPGTSEA